MLPLTSLCCTKQNIGLKNMANKEAEDFRSSLCDLTVNSKPLISMLTMLAEENQEHAEHIVKVIEKHISQVNNSLLVYGNLVGTATHCSYVIYMYIRLV